MAERGQATVELVAALPVLLLAGLVALQLLVAGYTMTLADGAAGAGALALALKSRFPGAEIYGTDISGDALDVARLNGKRTALEVTWIEGDLFDPLPESLRGTVDLIVANPPYVADPEFETLPEDVKREPRVALTSGPTGLEVVERIGAEVADWLRPGGVVAIEISEFQGETAPRLFAGVQVEVRRDLTGRDRYVVGVRS